MYREGFISLIGLLSDKRILIGFISKKERIVNWFNEVTKEPFQSQKSQIQNKQTKKRTDFFFLLVYEQKCVFVETGSDPKLKGRKTNRRNRTVPTIFHGDPSCDYQKTIPATFWHGHGLQERKLVRSYELDREFVYHTND